MFGMMLQGTFASAPVKRAITLSGGMSLTLSASFDYVDWYKDSILQAFSNNGFDISINTLSQNGSQCGISLTAQVWDTMSAETFRQIAINVIKSVQSTFVISTDVFTDVFMQIVSDGAKQISKDISKEVPKTNVTTANVAVKTTDNVINQIQKEGVLSPVVNWWDSVLFGEPIDILGAKIPKYVVYGALGLAIYKAVSGGKRGGYF